MEKKELQSLPLPPGSDGLPFIGDGFKLISEPNYFIKQFILNNFEKYGDIFKMKLFGTTAIYVRGSDANRFFLNSPNIVVNLPPSIQILLGGDSSVSNQIGDIHKSRRQILAQSFKPRNLEHYFNDIVSITEKYLNQWQQQKEITWYKEFQNYTFDIAIKFLMGIDNASSSELKHLYQTFELGLFTPFPINLPFTKFGRASHCREKILKTIEEIIITRKEQNDLGNDTLGILLRSKDEQGISLSLAELKNQMLTLLFTGFSTLTSSLTTFCLEITRNPAILKNLRQEQKQFTGSVSKEQLKQMTYLDQVLKEVLRLNPPLITGFRKVLADCEFNGYLIPKDATLFYHIAGTQLDPQVFIQPQKFNPENFDSSKKLKPSSYIPFGGGMRECLGKEFAKLEMKILAALLIRNCNWSLIPDQDLDLELLPSPHPKDGLKVVLGGKNEL